MSSNPTNVPTGTTANEGQNGAGGAPQQQDMHDKGVAYAAGKAGHKTNASTTEKISDGIRTAFRKVTGKDIPIKASGSFASSVDKS